MEVYMWYAVDSLCIIAGLSIFWYKHDTVYGSLGLLLTGFGVGSLLSLFNLL